MKEKKQKNKYLKFANVNKQGTIWMIVAIFALLISYCICLKEQSQTFIQIFSNILVVLLSIFCTTLFTGWLIETKRTNKLYSELLANDIFSAEEFLLMLPEEERTKLSNNLDKAVYFKGIDAKARMLEQLRNKIVKFGSKNHVYYDS